MTTNDYNVVLLGELGKKFGRRHRFEINNPAEAIRALCVNHQGFERRLLESADRGIAYRVVVGKEDVDAERLHDPSGRQQIKIVPVVAGAGGKFGQVILGAALLGIAWWNPAGIMATTLFSAGGTTVTLASLSVNVGLGLVLGGVAQMLSPQPRTDSPTERPENQPSYAFNGAVNTTAQGQPVPIGYGKLVVGSAVISAGIDVDQVSTFG